MKGNATRVYHTNTPPAPKHSQLIITGLVSPESRSKLYMWRLGARGLRRRRGGGEEGERRGCGGESGHGQEEAAARWHEETVGTNVFYEPLSTNVFGSETHLYSAARQGKNDARKHMVV